MATVALSYNGCTVLLQDAEIVTDEVDAARDVHTLAMQRGVYLPSTLEGARLIHITGLIAEETGDEDAVRATLNELAAALAVEELEWLYLWNDRRIQAVRQGFTKDYVDQQPFAAKIGIDFYCPDPRWQATAPTVLEGSGGLSGISGLSGGFAAQQYTFAITRTGTAPTEPLFRFTMNHPDNEVRNWTYYGPNLLTNTRFDLGESTTEPGMPVSWTAMGYGTPGRYYSHTEDKASIIINEDGTGARTSGLCQTVLFCEAGVTVSGQADICITKTTSGPIAWVRIEFLNAAMATLATHESVQYTTTGGTFITVGNANRVSPGGTAYVRFSIMCYVQAGAQVGVLARNCALVRAATSSFPGHFDNKVFDIATATTWRWGESVEVDVAEKAVRYFRGNDWVVGWPYFTEEQDMPVMDASSLPLHFSYECDHHVHWVIERTEKYWEA